jgi:hypothetical protein
MIDPDGTEADTLDNEEVLDLIDGMLEAFEDDPEVEEPGTMENALFQAITLIRSFVEKGVLQQECLEDVYDFITDVYDIADTDDAAEALVGSLPECSQAYFNRRLDKLISLQCEEEESEIDEIFRTVVRGGKRTRKRFLNPGEKRKFLTARRRAAFRKLARMRRSRRWKRKASTKARIKRSLRLAKSLGRRK